MDSDGSTLAVTDLPEWVDEEYLFRLFEPTQAVIGVKLSRLQSTGGGRVAHLSINSEENAYAIMQHYDGASPPNVDLRLNISRASEAHIRFEEFSAFVGDVAPAVTDAELQALFQTHYPSVFEAKVKSDPTTGVSKGYGFVRFANEAERDRAIREMQGAMLHGRALRLDVAAKRSTGAATAERNAFTRGVTPGDFDSTNTTLFVGGLTPAATEADLQAIFQPYGMLTYARVPPGKGCGFVQFVLRNAAERALAAVHGRLLHGVPLRLSWGRNAARHGRGATQGAAHGDQAALAAQAQAQPHGYAAHPNYAMDSSAQQMQQYQQYMQAGQYAQGEPWMAAQQGYYGAMPAAREPMDVWHGPYGEAAATSNPVVGYGGYTGHPEAGKTASRFGFQDPTYYDFTGANRRFSSVAPPMLAPIAMAPSRRVMRAGVAATV